MAYARKSALWIGAIAVAGTAAYLVRPDAMGANAVLLIGICFACELVDSGLGMGYGTILTPTLLLLGYSVADIVPTVLFSELLSGFAASFFHHQARNVDFRLKGTDLRRAVLLAAGSVVGVTVGVAISLNVPKDVLRVVIGCIILVSGMFVVLLARRAVEYRNWKMLSLSAVASFNKAVSGGGYGPLVTSGQILSGIRGKAAVGITSFAEAFTCLLAVGLFLGRGGYLNLAILVPMVTGALASVPFAVFAIHKAQEDHLKILIGILTMAMGAAILYKAVA